MSVNVARESENLKLQRPTKKLQKMNPESFAAIHTARDRSDTTAVIPWMIWWLKWGKEWVQSGRHRYLYSQLVGFWSLASCGRAIYQASSLLTVSLIGPKITIINDDKPSLKDVLITGFISASLHFTSLHPISIIIKPRSRTAQRTN